MTVKEWRERLAKPERVPGLVIATRYSLDVDAPPLDRIGEAIYSLDTNDTGDIIMWSVPPSTWPHGRVTITILTLEILHDAFVFYHAGQDWAIYDGDIVCIDGRPYGLSPLCWVTATKKLGTASPYPFDGFVMQGDTKTDHLVQFMLGEVRAIKRLETP